LPGTDPYPRLASLLFSQLPDSLLELHQSISCRMLRWKGGPGQVRGLKIRKLVARSRTRHPGFPLSYSVGIIVLESLTDQSGIRVLQFHAPKKCKLCIQGWEWGDAQRPIVNGASRFCKPRSQGLFPVLYLVLVCFGRFKIWPAGRAASGGVVDPQPPCGTRNQPESIRPALSPVAPGCQQGLASAKEIWARQCKIRVLEVAKSWEMPKP